MKQYRVKNGGQPHAFITSHLEPKPDRNLYPYTPKGLNKYAYDVQQYFQAIENSERIPCIGLSEYDGKIVTEGVEFELKTEGATTKYYVAIPKVKEQSQDAIKVYAIKIYNGFDKIHSYYQSFESALSNMHDIARLDNSKWVSNGPSAYMIADSISEMEIEVIYVKK